MFLRRFRLVLLACCLAALAGAASSQSQPITPSTADNRTDVRPPAIPAVLPFSPGETLEYEVSFSKLIFSGQIGRLKLWVSQPDDKTQPPDVIELKAEATSKGFFTWLFGLKIKDEFKTVVSARDFGLHTSTTKHDEGRVRIEKTSTIDRDARRVTYTERDLVNRKSAPKVKQAESPGWVQDMLSVIYLVRTQALRDGETLTIPVSDAAKVYDVEVVAGKRSEIKVDAGKYRAYEVEAKVFDGRLFKKKGQMIVWFSDDEKRLPVKARIKTGGATINIELVSVK
jgi:hypothetical protein